MLEIPTLRKNKISLSDYESEKDIENKLLLSTFSSLDFEVLEEILYSSIKTSLNKLVKNLDIDINIILNVLEKLKKASLLKIEKDQIIIDKKMRKYFEFEYLKFDEHFKPDMEFLQSLLQKIPIHILPIWYSIPRTSNNIFESIVDKYMSTPQLFFRYIEEIEHENPIFSGIIQEVYKSDNYEVKSTHLMKKYKLTKEEFHEVMLHMEFNFVLCLCYKKTEDHYDEIVTPFHEIKSYLLHINNKKAPAIENTSKIIRKRKSDFGFVEDMTSILEMIVKNDLSKNLILQNLTKELTIKDPDIITTKSYVNSLLNKLISLKFVKLEKDLFHFSKSSNQWLMKNDQNKALFLYHHHLNELSQNKLTESLISEKTIRESEKSIISVIDSGWIFFHDFIKGVIAPLNDDQIIKLRSFGKIKKYNFPEYNEAEKCLIKKVIFERLFEVGIVAVGSYQGKDCFSVTKFGKNIFGI